MRRFHTTTSSFVCIVLIFCYHGVLYPSPASPSGDDGSVIRAGIGRMMLGDYSGALDLLKGPLAARPEDPLVNFHAGVCRLNLGEYPAAIKNLTIATNAESISVRARFSRGRALNANGQLTEAVRDFEDVLQADSTFRPARLELLRLLCYRGDSAKVATYVSAPPDLNESLVLGRGWLTRGNVDESIRYAGRAASLAPREYNVRVLLADVLFARGEYGEALGGYGMLLVDNPSSPLLARKCALCYEQVPSRHLRTAVMMMQRYFRLAGDTTVGDAGKMGNWLYELQQYDSAEVFFRKIIQRDSTVTEGHFNLGLALLQQGKTDEALRHLARAEQLSYGDAKFLASIQKNLGAAYVKGREYKTALACFERALRYDPTYLDAIHSTAMCYDEMGRHVDALAWYRAFLTAAKDRIADRAILSAAEKRIEVLSRVSKTK
jgi:tetratricopeptide (TPR) repeat protein